MLLVPPPDPLQSRHLEHQQPTKPFSDFLQIPAEAGTVPAVIAFLQLAKKSFFLASKIDKEKCRHISQFTRHVLGRAIRLYYEVSSANLKVRI
jgi:hypothetical protein